MGILDDPTTLTLTELDATYALKPDNAARAVGQGELVLNVRDFGAVGDGLTDDTVALNATLAAAAMGGGTVLVPAGTYKTTAPLVCVSGITIRGVGRKLTRIDNAASDVLWISGENYTVEAIGLRSRRGGGHVMVIPGGLCLAQSAFRDLELNQANNAKNLIRYDGSGAATGGGLFDCHFSDFYFQHLPTATVPGVYVYSDSNNVFSANRFSRGRCQYSGAFFFDIQVNKDATYAYNNVWETINFEVCDGGGIRLMSAMNNGLHNIGFFDNGPIIADCIQIGRLSGTPPRGQSRGNTISNYHRSKGTLSGAKDIHLMSGGNTGTNNIIGISGPGSAGVIVDLGESGGYATVIGYDPTTVTIENVSATNTTLVSGSAGITTPSLSVAGCRVAPKGELILNVRDFGAVGDGSTDDTPAIRDALAAAATATSGSGVGPVTVVLPYTTNGYATSSLTVSSNVTLRGESRVTLKKIGASTGTFLTASGSDIRIEGLTVDANGLATACIVQVAASSTAVNLVDCKVTDSGGTDHLSGIETGEGVSDLLIERNTFDGVDTPILINKGPSRCTVNANRITNWKTRGICVLGDAAAATTDITITNNHISDNINSGDIRQPIQIVGVDSLPHQRVRVNFNTVIGGGKAYTAADSGTADGISLHRCVDFELIGNVSCDSGGMGIAVAQQCARGVVANNTCLNNDVGGIAIGSTTTASVASISVTGNVAMNNGQNRNGDRVPQNRAGLYIYRAKDLTVTGNTLGDDQRDKTQRYAVSMWSSTGLRFEANTCSGLKGGTFFNGGGVTGSHFGAGPAPIIKIVDSKVRNSARRARDPHLTTAVEAGGVYLVEAFLIYRSSATADMSISWATPPGARLNWVADGPRSSTGSPSTGVARDALVTASSTPLGGTATDVVATPRGILQVGGAAGALTLRWAQARAEASDTILRAGSYILVTRVG